MSSHAPSLPHAGTPSRRGPLSWFADAGVAVKILVALFLLAAVALGAGGLALTRLGSVNAAAQDIYTRDTAPLEQLDGVRAATLAARLDLRDLALAGSPAEQQTAKDKLAADDARVDEKAAAYAPSAADPQLFSSFLATWQQYKQARDRELVPALTAGDLPRFRTRNASEVAPLSAASADLLDRAFDGQTAHAAASAEKAASGYRSARTTVLVVLLLGVFWGLALGAFVARQIVVPLRRVSEVLDGLAAGDLTRRTEVEGRDEVGRMAAALDTALGNLRGMVGQMAGSAGTLAGAAEELAATNSQISASAEQTAAQASVVSGAADEVSVSVSTVASGAEEMGASIREIAQNASEAARVAVGAVAVAQSTNDTVTKLGESSAEIGQVVAVITSIAEQTNLLALNATIEAARAGEAGKGFAVVANEVKELAQETARATEDISRRISAIRTDTSGAVAAISEIGEVVGRINDYTTAIASAVEEQSATTSEMARSVGEAASGSGHIAENITGVADAARLTTAGVGDSQAAAGELSRMASELSGLVGQFRY